MMDQSGNEPRPGSDPRSLAWIAPAFVAGLLAYWLSRSPALRRAIARHFGIHPRSAPRPRSVDDRKLSAWRDAILGNSKQAVMSVLGSPRGARMTSGDYHALHADAPDVPLRADTWYYPLPSRARTAMAITFSEDLATAVQFIHVPALASNMPKSS